MIVTGREGGSDMTSSSWRTSTHSNPNGACVECAGWTDWGVSSFSFANGNCIQWRKSTHCQSGECLEARGGVQVRDSKLGDGSPVLMFRGDAWRRFISGLR
jgi:hypothetical protein